MDNSIPANVVGQQIVAIGSSPSHPLSLSFDVGRSPSALVTHRDQGKLGISLSRPWRCAPLTILCYRTGVQKESDGIGGNNRQACFFAEEDHRYYLDSRTEAARRCGGHVHAFVLMTNHVHLLLTPEAPETPSLLLQSAGRRYVRYVNQVYRRSGMLFEAQNTRAIREATEARGAGSRG